MLEAFMAAKDCFPMVLRQRNMAQAMMLVLCSNVVKGVNDAAVILETSLRIVSMLLSVVNQCNAAHEERIDIPLVSF